MVWLKFNYVKLRFNCVLGIRLLIMFDSNEMEHKWQISIEHDTILLIERNGMHNFQLNQSNLAVWLRFNCIQQWNFNWSIVFHLVRLIWDCLGNGLISFKPPPLYSYQPKFFETKSYLYENTILQYILLSFWSQTSPHVVIWILSIHIAVINKG